MKKFILYFAWLVLIAFAVFLFKNQKDVTTKPNSENINIFGSNSWNEIKQMTSEMSSGLSEIGEATKMLNISKQINKEVDLLEKEEGLYYEKEKVGFTFLIDKTYFSNIAKENVAELVTNDINSLFFSDKLGNILLGAAILENKKDLKKCDITQEQFFDKMDINDNVFYCQDLVLDENDIFIKECFAKKDNKCYEIRYDISYDDNNGQKEFDLEKFGNIEEVILKNLVLK